MSNLDGDSRVALPGSLLSRTLNVLAITRELGEGGLNDGMMHSWKPHEVLTIHQYCKSAGLVVYLFDTDLGEPIAAFSRRDHYEAIASVTRYDEGYLLVDGEGKIVRGGTSLLDVLNRTVH